MSADAMETRDPREILGFYGQASGRAAAVPKANVGRLAAERCGTLGRFEEAAGFKNVGEMVRGARRMSNENVLHAAIALDVSPLVVLDLADEGSEAPPIREIMERREELFRILEGTILTESPQDAEELAEHSSWTGAASSEPQAHYERGPVSVGIDLDSPVYARIEIAHEAVSARGDYRDLGQLAADMVRAYPESAAALLASPIEAVRR